MVSRIMFTCSPAAWSDLMADSRPGPGPFTTTSISWTPCSWTALATWVAAIWAAKELPLAQALEHGWQLVMRQDGHPDIAEGVAASLEKRAPHWRERDPGDVE